MRRRTSILLIIISFILFAGCNDSLRAILPAEEEKSYTPEELAVLFQTYEDRFLEAANIVLDNEPLEDMMIQSKEGVVSVWTETKKTCFTEEEWEKIVALFHDTGLSRIERNVKGGAESIQFLYGKEEGTILYYFPTDDEENRRYHTQFTSRVEQVGDGWWIGLEAPLY